MSDMNSKYYVRDTRQVALQRISELEADLAYYKKNSLGWQQKSESHWQQLAAAESVVEAARVVHHHSDAIGIQDLGNALNAYDAAIGKVPT